MTNFKTSIVYFKAIDRHDIEELRLIRNTFVGKNIFQYDYEISEKNQIKWYNNLEHELYHYFIVKLVENNLSVGFVHFSQKGKKDIENNRAEVGIILKSNIENFTIPHQCISLLIRFCFIERKFNCLYGIFNIMNVKAIRLIKFFGFQTTKQSFKFVTETLDRNHYKSEVAKKCEKFLV